MLTAEAPRHVKHTRGTWTREQAVAAAAKSVATRQRKALERKQAALNPTPEPEPVNEPDPYKHTCLALERAAKRNCGQLAANLALALERLTRAKPRTNSQVQDKPSSSYTPTNGISARQPTRSRPQVTQAIEPKPVAHDANFAQYPDHLVQGEKESLLSGPVATGGTGGTGPGQGEGGVIDPITRTALLEVEQLRAQVKELQAKLALVTGSSVKPSVEPSCGLVALGPHEGMEKFLVGGTWVWGKRRK